MTAFDRIEPRLPELIDELASARVPDYFDDLLRATAQAPQRPAWSALERWLPMGEIARSFPRSAMPWRPILAFAILTLLVLGGLLVYAGSRPRLPAPFGPAENGVLLYREPGGSIVSIDPDTGAKATVAAASDSLGFPVPARDGRRIALPVFGSLSPLPIIVSGMDGSDQTTLAGDYREVDALDWSPDGTHLAIVANEDGMQSIIVAAADGSDARTLPLGREVSQVTYLPDGRLAVVAAEGPDDSCPGSTPDTNDCALFMMAPDGKALERLLPAAQFHGINTLAPSPDGSRLLWVEWVTGREGRLHVFDLKARTDRTLPTGTFPEVYAINRAWFSPDGTSILFDLFEADGDHWAVIPATGGEIRRLGPEWPGDTPDAAWSPDGRSVLVRYPTTGGDSELWLLDATGSGRDRKLQVNVPDLPTWQRLPS